MQPSRMRWRLTFWALMLVSYNVRISCADDPTFSEPADAEFNEVLAAPEAVMEATSDAESPPAVEDESPPAAQVESPPAEDESASAAQVELAMLRAELLEKTSILDEIERKKNKVI